EGEELFVYFNTPARRPDVLWQGLVNARLPTRVYDPTIGEEGAATLAKQGLTIERGPIPFADIARRSRMVMSHGGLGFASSALAAGIPQVILPLDQENRLTAEALVELGAGRKVGLEQPEAGSVTQVLRAAWTDAGLRARASDVASGFRARMAPTAEEALA